MSKIGNAVFEGQEFATANYSLPYGEFMDKAIAEFGAATTEVQEACAAFRTIANELAEYYGEPIVPAEVDEDGIPF